jgi:hypothetical protein
MPVREAIKRLHSEGLVEVLPSRRVRVAELSRGEIEDIYDMRAALEPLAIALAVPRLTRAALRNASHALEAADDEEDADTFGVRNAAFHLSLMNACGRPRLLNGIASLLDLSDRYQRAALRHAEHNALVRAEHAALLEAARAGDAEEAARLTEGTCAAPEPGCWSSSWREAADRHRLAVGVPRPRHRGRRAAARAAGRQRGRDAAAVGGARDARRAARVVGARRRLAARRPRAAVRAPDAGRHDRPRGDAARHRRAVRAVRAGHGAPHRPARPGGGGTGGAAAPRARDAAPPRRHDRPWRGGGCELRLRRRGRPAPGAGLGLALTSRSATAPISIALAGELHGAGIGTARMLAETRLAGATAAVGMALVAVALPFVY